MKFFTVLVLFLLSLSAPATVEECHKLESQDQKNECMAYERDLSIGRFVAQVTLRCSENDNVLELVDSEEYSMALDECMTKKFNDLAKQLKKAD